VINVAFRQVLILNIRAALTVKGKTYTLRWLVITSWRQHLTETIQLIQWPLVFIKRPVVESEMNVNEHLKLPACVSSLKRSGVFCLNILSETTTDSHQTLHMSRCSDFNQFNHVYVSSAVLYSVVQEHFCCLRDTSNIKRNETI
jgi:hypothetical protein